MAKYATIYSPDGEHFEVGEERAADLRLNSGWSSTPPNKFESEAVVTDGEPGEEVCDATTENVERRKGRNRQGE